MQVMGYQSTTLVVGMDVQGQSSSLQQARDEAKREAGHSPKRQSSFAHRSGWQWLPLRIGGHTPKRPVRALRSNATVAVVIARSVMVTGQRRSRGCLSEWSSFTCRDAIWSSKTVVPVWRAAAAYTEHPSAIG